MIAKKSSNSLLNGLISLKGGELAQEISESGLRPKLISIEEIFPEEFFKEKYILHIPK
jgi:16S rRNA (guanine527-N7)-methyltransferase